MAETQAAEAYIRPGLDVTQGGVAEKVMIREQDIAQEIWREIQTISETEKKPNIRRDYSENGTLLLAGRYLLAHKKPAYWIVRDNRVHFSVPFDQLSAHERMSLVNQILVAFANRSDKDDIKSAALAVSEKGHFYVAHNTQESDNLAWDKECAEVNLGRVVKQLNDVSDKIKHVYVLGGLTDEHGKMHVHDHLIGMCMRCVENVAPLMHPQAAVTIIPANDGESQISLSQSAALKNVKPREAWEVPYQCLKEPSIIRFSDGVHAGEKKAFEQMQKGDIKYTGFKLDVTQGKKYDETLLNRFMVEQIAKKIQRSTSPVSHASMALVEIREGNKTRYEYGIEIRSPEHNAMIPPLSVAVTRMTSQIPRDASKPHITRIYYMGYNADGSPLDTEAGQWDRAIKRTVPSELPEVVFLPLNDGTRFPKGGAIIKPLSDMVPTDFRGSKQHDGQSNGGPGCC